MRPLPPAACGRGAHTRNRFASFNRADNPEARSPANRFLSSHRCGPRAGGRSERDRFTPSLRADRAVGGARARNRFTSLPVLGRRACAKSIHVLASPRQAPCTEIDSLPCRERSRVDGGIVSTHNPHAALSVPNRNRVRKSAPPAHPARRPSETRPLGSPPQRRPQSMSLDIAWAPRGDSRGREQ